MLDDTQSYCRDCGIQYMVIVEENAPTRVCWMIVKHGLHYQNFCDHSKNFAYVNSTFCSQALTSCGGKTLVGAGHLIC
jgi:hypothetical protein